MKWLWLSALLIASPAIAQVPATDGLLPPVSLVPTWNDYWRLCAGDRQADALCRRLAAQIAQSEMVQGSFEAQQKEAGEMRAKGCVQLTDEVYVTMPPQYDWLCPP